jgi:hypothetical protein
MGQIPSSRVKVIDVLSTGIKFRTLLIRPFAPSSCNQISLLSQHSARSRSACACVAGESQLEHARVDIGCRSVMSKSKAQGAREERGYGMFHVAAYTVGVWVHLDPTGCGIRCGNEPRRPFDVVFENGP